MTHKVNYIPHRQKCIDKEHPYDCGARDVYDDVREKSQEQVNQDVDAAILAEKNRAEAVEALKANSADVYTKSETYNKTELNNMITTPSQQYVSVKATDQTADVTDVLPATGEADTVYRVGNWDGSQFDASVYSEYAWNGSSYVHLNTKTQVGEVFDISAYHATGGTLATYADLSAALDSNNGGGVPQSLQEGGMSVKFVRSSDNKYVQFRYMLEYENTAAGRYAFINEANWQGVDTEPKPTSDNMVNSGGTFNSLARIGIPYNIEDTVRTNVVFDGCLTRIGAKQGDIIRFELDSETEITNKLLNIYANNTGVADVSQSTSIGSLYLHNAIDINFNTDYDYVFIHLAKSNISASGTLHLTMAFVNSLINQVRNNPAQKIETTLNNVDGTEESYDLNISAGKDYLLCFEKFNATTTSTSRKLAIRLQYEYSGTVYHIINVDNGSDLSGTNYPVSIPEGATNIKLKLRATGKVLVNIYDTDILSLSYLDNKIDYNKQLFDELDRNVGEITTTTVDADLVDVFPNASYVYRSNSGDKSYVVPVSAGDTLYVKNKAGQTRYTYVALVTAYPVAGEAVAFMTGISTYQNYTDGITLNIPENGYAIIVSSTNNSRNTTNPLDIIINGVNKVHLSLEEKVNELELQETDTQNSFRTSEYDMFDIESRWWEETKFLEDKYGNSEQEAVEALITKVANRAGTGKYQIAVISDTHGSGAYSYKGNINANFQTCFRSISVFNKIVSHCDAGLHGGDISCDYGTSRNRILTYMKSVLRHFRFDKPFFITKGNHDENNDQYIEADMTNLDWETNTYYKRIGNTISATTESEWRGDNLYIRRKELVSDKEFSNMAQHWLCPQNAVWGNGAYYFYDIDAVKIRFIVANSFPVTDNHVVSEDEEYLWLAQTALNFSEKDIPTDWSVVMLRHTQSTNITDLANCINAFRNGTSWTYGNTTVDFGELNGGGMTFIAHIHGHEHQWCFSNGAGFFDIGENASFVAEADLGDATKYGISVWTIDTINSKVYEDTIDGKTWIYNYVNNKLEIGIGDSFTCARSGLSSITSVVSSDTSVATCDGSVVTGVGAGNATITISNNGVSFEYTITVTN